MNLQVIIDYINQWKGNTSQDIIRQKLRDSGYPQELIDQAFNTVYSPTTSQPETYLTSSKGIDLLVGLVSVIFPPLAIYIVYKNYRWVGLGMLIPVLLCGVIFSLGVILFRLFFGFNQY